METTASVNISQNPMTTLLVTQMVIIHEEIKFIPVKLAPTRSHKYIKKVGDWLSGRESD
jgi:hypothetical protein